MSILSREPDGCGFYYGFLGLDRRQINVRLEPFESSGIDMWHAYVAGDFVIACSSKEIAEHEAVAWMKRHPEKVADEV